MNLSETGKIKKRDRSVIPLLAVALALLCLFAALIGLGIINNTLFRNFKKSLQADVEYAMDGGSLEFTVNGQIRQAGCRTPDAILFALSEAGAGKRVRSTDSYRTENHMSGNEICVAFGSGNRITICETVVRDGDGNTSPGIMVAYVSGGKTYAYDTGQIKFSKLLNYIEQFENYNTTTTQQ